MTPQLGREIRPAGIPVISIEPKGITVEPRPVETHNLERDAADTGMYGNDTWGDCVFVAIEKDRVVTAETLGCSITKLTAKQVVDNYKAFTGATTPPGPGAVIVYALKWAQNHPERWGGSKLLVYADVPITQNSARNAVHEFCSIVVGARVYSSMEYPNKVWYNAPRGSIVGGHAVVGGTYNAVYDWIKTWGYMAQVNDAGFDTVDEVLVLVWDFQWNALDYQRQVELVAAFEQFTGKTWTGPQPIPPVISEAVMVRHGIIKPKFRILDTRKGIGLSGLFTVNAPRRIQVAGVGPIPPNAVAVTGNLTVTGQGAKGYLAATDSNAAPATSDLNFPVNDDRANHIECPLDATGGMWLRYVSPVGSSGCHAIFDPSGFDIPE